MPHSWAIFFEAMLFIQPVSKCIMVFNVVLELKIPANEKKHGKYALLYICSPVQFSRLVISSSTTPWPAVGLASLSIINSQSLLKLISIESVMPSNHLIRCYPIFVPPSIFPSIRVFSKKSVLCIRWPKYWSFRFSISPSSEYSGLISFRIG